MNGKMATHQFGPGVQQQAVDPLGSFLWADSKLWIARQICFWLLVHFVRRADSRAACTAGSSSATSTPMIAITTRSSISVNPDA